MLTEQDLSGIVGSHATRRCTAHAARRFRRFAQALRASRARRLALVLLLPPTMSTKQVVVAYDFSSTADVALDRAVELASRAPEHVLHVVTGARSAHRPRARPG